MNATGCTSEGDKLYDTIIFDVLGKKRLMYPAKTRR